MNLLADTGQPLLGRLTVEVELERVVEVELEQVVEVELERVVFFALGV